MVNICSAVLATDHAVDFVEAGCEDESECGMTMAIRAMGRMSLLSVSMQWIFMTGRYTLDGDKKDVAEKAGNT